MRAVGLALYHECASLEVVRLDFGKRLVGCGVECAGLRCRRDVYITSGELHSCILVLRISAPSSALWHTLCLGLSV